MALSDLYKVFSPNAPKRLMLHYEKLQNHPGRFAKLIKGASKLFHIDHFNGVSLDRLFDVFSLNYSEPRQNVMIDKTLNLVFVSTAKDFEILPLAIQGGFFSTSNFRSVTATVIVPNDQVAECVKLLDLLRRVYPIVVSSESTIVPEKDISVLRDRFGWRYGWVLQQIIKIRYSVSAVSDYVLIIDSDTVLVKKRVWVSSDGRQLLTPSWEFNQSYYKFLNSCGGFPLTPKFTFVSHHMLVQPHFFKAATETMGWSTLDSIIESLVSHEFEDTVSPFSIDYELYGQYIYLYHPDEFFLEKWGNTSVSAAKLLRLAQFETIRKKYGRSIASISSHSYFTH
jgi:hypothetical protein